MSYRFLSHRLIYLSLGLIASVTSAAQAQTVDLESTLDKSQVYRVETQVEHSGTVIVEYHEKDRENQQYQIDVKAKLDYKERFIGSVAKPQAVRLYDVAKAEMVIDNVPLVRELAPENGLLVARIQNEHGNALQFASVNDILQQRELELIRNPCDSIAIPGLVSKSKIKSGTSWEPDREQLARLLKVDRVIYSDVKLELKETTETTSRLHMVGKIKAEVDDTLTEMAVAGVILVDPQDRLVRGIRLTINERRRAAQIAPGFEGQTKIDVRVSKTDEVPQLTTESIREIAQTKTIRSLLKWKAESDSFELKYNPAWKIITSDQDAAILRFVNEGELLSQCSIVRMASRSPESPLTLQDFTAEVSRIITKDPNSRIVRADEGKNLNGFTTLKTYVAGIEEDVPMNWLYYNVSSPEGQQVTFVFMLEEKHFDRVAPAAQRLVDGFAFNHPQDSPQYRIGDSPAAQRDAKSDVKRAGELAR